jgi:hypothetical protein
MNEIIAKILDRFKADNPKAFLIMAGVLIATSAGLNYVDSVTDLTGIWQQITNVVLTLASILLSTPTKKYINPDLAEKINQLVAEEKLKSHVGEC